MGFHPMQPGPLPTKVFKDNFPDQIIENPPGRLQARALDIEDAKHPNKEDDLREEIKAANEETVN